MEIEYRVNRTITTDQFLELLKNSTLGERRPVEDRDCIDGMLANSNLIVTAWSNDELVGIARSMTDFNYACYLPDLAVSQTFQRKGIGKKLQVITQEQLNRHCKLILLSAPAANEYYKKIGFTNNQRCWVLNRNSVIG